jgi:hypothetical protein
MVLELAASDVMILVYAFGAGALAIVVLMIGLFGMFEADDRRALLNVLRHPVQVVLRDSEPDGEAELQREDVHSG